MKTNWVLSLLGMLVLLSGCEKDESSELVVVQGSVYDDIMQQPVENLLVYIHDVECRDFMCGNGKIVDSTRTDSNGLFKMNYKAKNLNSLYLTLRYLDRSYVPAGSQESSYQLVRGNNVTHFILKKTSVLKARVIVINNPHPPLKVFDGIEAHMVEIPGIQKDTVIYLRTVATKKNEIALVVHSPDMLYYRARKDCFYPGSYADTFNITIEANPETFPITNY